MRNLVLALVSLVVMASATSAGNAEVPNGSVWTGGGETVTVTVADAYWSGITSVTVNVRDSNGSSTGNAQNGSEGATSTPDKPTCDESDPMTTPGNTGKTYRVKDGKLQRKKRDGTWVNMEQMKDPLAGNGALGGDDVVGIPGH